MKVQILLSLSELYKVSRINEKTDSTIKPLRDKQCSIKQGVLSNRGLEIQVSYHIKLTDEEVVNMEKYLIEKE